MYSIQEILDKTVEQRKSLEHFMDEKAYFDPAEKSIFNGLKRSVSREIYETIKKVSLAEFLSKGNTAVGAQYLVPDVLAAKVYSSMQTRDIIPLISADIITPKSDTCKVNVGLQNAHIGHAVGKPHETSNTVQATITMQRVSANIPVTIELIEDNDYGLIDWQVQEAAKAIVAKGNNIALTVLKSASDGRGTTIAVAAGSDTTTPANVGSAIGVVASGAQSSNYSGFIADTMVCTTEVWGDALAVTAGHNAYPSQKQGYDAWFMGLNTVFCNDPILYAAFASNRMTNCVSIVFAKDFSLLTARKSWGRIENYSKPYEDLAGAVITGRMDAVTMNDDSIAVLTET